MAWPCLAAGRCMRMKVVGGGWFGAGRRMQRKVVVVAWWGRGRCMQISLLDVVLFAGGLLRGGGSWCGRGLDGQGPLVRLMHADSRCGRLLVDVAWFVGGVCCPAASGVALAQVGHAWPWLGRGLNGRDLVLGLGWRMGMSSGRGLLHVSA